MTLLKIKSEALSLFATKGYEGTSLSDISGKVGIRKPSLYAHIESKEQLFMLVVEELQQEYKEIFIQAYDESVTFAVDKKLFHIFKIVFQYLMENKDKAMLWNRIFFFPPDTLKHQLEAKLIDLEQSFTPMLTEIVEEGVREGVFEASQKDLIIRTYYCMTDGYIMHRMYEGFQFVDYELEGIWNLFWNGLKAKKVEGKLLS